MSSEVVNWSGATLELLSDIPASVRREFSSISISGSSCSETSVNSSLRSTSLESPSVPTSNGSESAAGLSSVESNETSFSSLAGVSASAGCSVSVSSASVAGASCSASEESS